MPKLDDLSRWTRNSSGEPVKRLERRNKGERGKKTIEVVSGIKKGEKKQLPESEKRLTKKITGTKNQSLAF